MRRSKLSRAERERRRPKREHRAATVIPHKRRRERIENEFREAAQAYVAAVMIPEGLRGERCICTCCGLEQNQGMGFVSEDGEVVVASCEHCGHEVGVSHEAFNDGY